MLPAGLAVPRFHTDAVASSVPYNMIGGRINDCFIENTGRHGIHVIDLSADKSPPHVVCTDWNVMNNWIGTTGGSGIFLSDAIGWKVM